MLAGQPVSSVARTVTVGLEEILARIRYGTNKVWVLAGLFLATIISHQSKPQCHQQQLRLYLPV